MPSQGSYPKGDHAGGELDFENLVEAYYGPLYRFALSLTGTENDACDLTQEVFHVWAVKGHQLREAARVKAWLFTTLHRLFLESRRRVTRFPHVEIGQAEGEIPSVHPDLVNRLDGSRLVELLGRIDPQFQAAVALFYLEECAYQEIAQILNVPLGTVKSRIARGLAQLKRLVLEDSISGVTGGGAP